MRSLKPSALTPLLLLALTLLAPVPGCDTGSDGGGGQGKSGGAKGTDTSPAGADTQQSPPTGGKDIVIGHFASMSGSTATFGTSADEGIRLAMDEINARGGVLGRRVVVIT